jgi:hypothetical protein
MEEERRVGGGRGWKKGCKGGEGVGRIKMIEKWWSGVI